MVDHHVDRPGVDAQQCVKLTGTNSSIGFIALIILARIKKTKTSLLIFAGLVAMAGRKTPDPIPNSAVKLPSANGTSSQDAGE